MPNSISNVKLLRDLRLRLCNFAGQVPAPSFDDFAELVFLDLSENCFTGSLPSLASSRKIVKLQLSGNDFRGTIPSTYGDVLRNLETLDLSSNSLRGAIPSSLFSIPSINSIHLQFNWLSGQIQDFPNATVPSSLTEINLSWNELQGPIPTSIFRLTSLETLLLLNNNFSGTIDAGMFGGLKHLYQLGISGSSNLFFDVSGGNTTSLAQISNLRLRSCNIRAFPNFLRNNSVFTVLDLSGNKITGEVPKWVSDVSTYSLNLSHNLLIGFEKSGANNLTSSMLNGFEKPGPNLTSSMLAILDLHSNSFEGPFLDPPPSANYLDYSNNKFTSTIQSDVYEQSFMASFISFANNSFSGEIPLSLCKLKYLEVLDLSDNHFNGSISQCLGSTTSLKIMRLRNNKLKGMFPERLGTNCSLRTLDLNQNHVEGPLPRWLTNCTSLEVLDLGNNHLNGSFPVWLETLPQLRVLVLRSNNFDGSIANSQTRNAFPLLQIIDVASNNFKGQLPTDWFRNWKAMMKDEHGSQFQEILGFSFAPSEWYYQDSVTVTIKGLEVKFDKILTIYTTIDLSNNQFKGTIPERIGELESLFALNMLRNNFTGRIPSSLAVLKELESLDLSQNQLSGRIPPQLSTLTFLSFLNLSINQLAGEIPRSRLFDTFAAASFEGNAGLCGPPLSKTCHKSSSPGDPNTPEANDLESGEFIDWKSFWSGFGCGEAVGIIVGLIAGNVVSNLVLKKRGSRRRRAWISLRN